MTFSFGLVAALASCANNLGLAHTLFQLPPLLFPKMLHLPLDLNLCLENWGGEQHIQTGTIFKPEPGTTCRVTHII